MNIDFSLVVPFYNEEKNVVKACEDLIKAFDRSSLTYELIAVDNGSWDKTKTIIPELACQYPLVLKTLKVDVNQGMGWGIRQGFNMAIGTYIGYCAGDRQIPAEDISAVFLAAKNFSLDFAQGKRTREDSFLRRINSICHNFIFHLFFRCPIYDIGANPKVINRKWLNQLNLQSCDWFIDGEIIIKMHRLGGKMQDFPVTFRKREHGESKINLLTLFRMFWNIVKWKYKIFFKSSCLR